MSVLYYETLPAYREALARAQSNRDREFLGTSYSICGIRIRPLCLRDFQILDELKSPFIYRRTPSHPELVFFLWLLSPEIERWHDEKGWRKAWLFGTRFRFLSVEYWQSVLHGRACRRRLRLGPLEKLMRQWRAKNPDVPFVLPEDCASAAAIRQCFDYVDIMFRDGPPKGGGGESYFSHLAGWSDTIRSEYHCEELEVFTMPLPKLWQTIRAIEKRKNPKASWATPECTEIRRAIHRSLRTKQFTLEDFIQGKPRWDGKEWVPAAPATETEAAGMAARAPLN